MTKKYVMTVTEKGLFGNNLYTKGQKCTFVRDSFSRNEITVIIEGQSQAITVPIIHLREVS